MMSPATIEREPRPLRYVFSVALRLAQVSFLVALEAAESDRGRVSASTGVVLPVPALMRAPNADQTPFLRLTQVSYLRALDASLSTMLISSVLFGVVFDVAAWICVSIEAKSEERARG